jgi:hypothetical protein
LHLHQRTVEGRLSKVSEILFLNSPSKRKAGIPEVTFLSALAERWLYNCFTFLHKIQGFPVRQEFQIRYWAKFNLQLSPPSLCPGYVEHF